MECLKCGARYKVNGSNIYECKCPVCLGGKQLNKNQYKKSYKSLARFSTRQAFVVKSPESSIRTFQNAAASSGSTQEYSPLHPVPGRWH